VLLRSLADSFSDDAAPTPADVSAGLRAGLTQLQLVGKAQLGDKTMLDALDPLVTTLSGALAAGEPLEGACYRAVAAASAGAERTADLLPRIGRARPHAEHSRGTPDPGATSLALVCRAVVQALVPKGAITGEGNDRHAE
jgi:dihydroxyacetone kinase